MIGFINYAECVYCAVRTEILNIIQVDDKSHTVVTHGQLIVISTVLSAQDAAQDNSKPQIRYFPLNRDLRDK